MVLTMTPGPPPSSGSYPARLLELDGGPSCHQYCTRHVVDRRTNALVCFRRGWESITREHSFSMFSRLEDDLIASVHLQLKNPNRSRAQSQDIRVLVDQ